jgi:two-component system response regulator RegX3
MGADLEAFQAISPRTAGQLRTLRIGGIELDVDGIRLRVNGTEVPIPHKEFKLLEALMANPGKVLTRQDLLDLAWGKGRPDAHKALEVHFHRLRTRLAKHGAPRQLIRAVRGVGYTLEILDP